MLSFLKRHSRIFLIIIGVIAAVALAVACAFFTIKITRQVMSNVLLSGSYISDLTSKAQSDLSEKDSQSSALQQEITDANTAPKPKIINAYLPYEKQTLAAGTTFNTVISARPDSTTVTATFNGQTISLEPVPYQLNADGTAPEFINFVGTFITPSGNEKNLDLGAIKYYAEWQGYSETHYSPKIITLRDTIFDRSTIVEIVDESAETFSAVTTDDYSDPRNSPLPKGTVDYKVGDIVFDRESGKYYYNLRCGKRVYITTKNTPDTNNVQVAAIYAGELPDTNTISFSSAYDEGQHTYITFDTAWKAPFAVSVGPQQYVNPATQDFMVESVTYNYIDIKFYYAAQIGGNILLPENPIFYHAEAIPQEDGSVLRLHLKKTGAFYGWDAYYNSAGQLEFRFLNPQVISASDNWYGADLTGATVLLDVGHGGRDPGALGLNPAVMPEAERNLNLAYKVKAELESIGATVIMMRYDDSAVTNAQRCSTMRKTAADLCVSIHHDSSENSAKNGARFFCFNAFSNAATQSLFERTQAASIYGSTAKGWHYFYLGRVTTCPLVLIENGYISSTQDFATISSDAINNQKAYSIVLGIADYFLSIQ